MAVIRVLQVFTIMNRGGAESMIMNYYRKIDKHKFQFDFLVHRKEKAAFDDEIEQLGGKIYRLDPINPLKPKRYFENLRQFFKTHNNYKIIHSHLNTFSCFPLKIASEFNIPCRIAHAHIAIEKVSIKGILQKKESLKETVKKLIKLRLRKSINTYNTHAFSCGEKAGKWLFGNNTDFVIMNNAIDTDSFSPDTTIRNRYRETFNLDNKLVIGHIGRFSSQKNHLYLLKIFNELLKLNKNSELILIGDGSLRDTIQTEIDKLAINNVQLLGVRADIPELYQMLDVFVFPSFYEGLPVTLIEAQAAGLKVLASDKITNEVNITDNIKFASIDHNPKVWAKSILDLALYSKKSQNQNIIDGNFDIESNVKQIEKFYTEQANI